MNSRPLGISVLAGWFALGGLFVLVLQFLFTSELLDAFPPSAAPAAASMFFLAGVGVLSIAAGVTMWLGKRIGWWLGFAHLSLSAVRNTWAIFTFYQASRYGHGFAEVLPRVYLKHGLRVCFSIMLIYYLFRPQVLAFFRRLQLPTSA